MNSPRRAQRIQRAQQGFAAIAAVFLLVVVAAFGAFMVTFSNTQQLNAARDVQGSRAYWAARAGLSWGVARVVAVPACPVSPTVMAVDGFNVTVTCATQAYDERGTPRNIFTLTSIATGGGAVGGLAYIERSVTASLEL